MDSNSEAAARATQAAQVRKDRQQAKVVLKEFREHLDELDRDKEKALDCRSPVLSTHFEKAAANLNKACTVDQAYVDAQIFHKLGDYARRQAAQLRTGLCNYDVNSFVDAFVLSSQKAKTSLAPDEENAPMVINFHEIGESVQNNWKTVPMVDFMLGNEPSEETESVPQRRKPQRVKKGLVVTKPKEVVSGETDLTETDKLVRRMKRELRKQGKINFWDFVVDPDEDVGYARTVENIFHFSFLIKDMNAILDLRSQPPTVEYSDPQSDNMANGAPKSEIILSFDFEAWKNVIHKYKIRSCLLLRTKKKVSKSRAGDERPKPTQQTEVEMQKSEERDGSTVRDVQTSLSCT